MAHYPHFPRESDPHYVDFHAFHKKYRPDARCEFASHATLDGDAPTVRQDATPHRLIGPGQLRAECDIKSPMAPQNHRVQSSERRRPSSPREGLPRNFKPQRGRRLGRSATKKRSAITSRSRTTPSPTTAVREQLRTNSLFSEYGSSPPYEAWVVAENISNNQHNVLSDNTYSGPWSFNQMDGGVRRSEWVERPIHRPGCRQHLQQLATRELSRQQLLPAKCEPSKRGATYEDVACRLELADDALRPAGLARANS
jgi:hypothetical protein